MKNVILALLLMFACAVCALGQTAGTQKFEEFGVTTCDEYRARVDLLMLNLTASPGAKGYVIVYEGNVEEPVYDKKYRVVGKYLTPSAKGSAKALISYFKNHLGFRKYPTERFVFINGGFRKKFSIEFWVVAEGSTPPPLSPTLKKIKQYIAKPITDDFCGGI